MADRVVFAAEASAHLASIYEYIARASNPDRAHAFIKAIADYCESFRTFPNRGTRRDDLRPGLRTIGFRRRVTIAFAVEGGIVVVLGVYYGGRDMSLALRRLVTAPLSATPR